MITFEKAITQECLGNTKEANELYKLSADEKSGLPVSHWRKRALYYLERNTPKVANYTDYFCTQWNVFFNLHTYSFLHPHIRYLAISSVSRVNNEPEMAVVIFRTCLEICLELYWDVSLEGKDNFLGPKIETLFKGKIENKIYTALRIIVEEGNLAAHPFKTKKYEKGDTQVKKEQPKKNDRTKEKPFEYKNKEISCILKAFDTVMNFCNDMASRVRVNLLLKDLDLL